MLTAFQRAFERVSPKSHAFRVVRKVLVLGSEQEEDPDHKQYARQYLLGHLLVVW